MKTLNEYLVDDIEAIGDSDSFNFVLYKQDDSWNRCTIINILAKYQDLESIKRDIKALKLKDGNSIWNSVEDLKDSKDYIHIQYIKPFSGNNCYWNEASEFHFGSFRNSILGAMTYLRGQQVEYMNKLDIKYINDYIKRRF